MEDERRSLAVSDGESANAPEKARAPRLLDQVRACCRARYTACARSVLTWAGSRVTPAVCVCPLQSSHSAMRLDFRFGSRTEVEGVESRMSGIKCCVRPLTDLHDELLPAIMSAMHIAIRSSESINES